MPPATDSPWVVAVVMLPLGGAVATFVLGRRWLTTLAALASCATVASVSMLTWHVATGGAQRHRLGGWGAPLGIELAVDGLSALLLLTTALTGIIVSVHAHGYFDIGAHATREPSDRRRFWPLWLLLWSGLNAVFVSADLFNLYVSLELVVLSAVALVALANTRVALAAALRYLLAGVLGSLFYLLAVALIYAVAGTLDLAQLRAGGAPVPVAATWLLVTGLVLKSALFPLHFWLPAAHASAPAPVSALLSGLVVKASFYVLWRVWFHGLPGGGPPMAGWTLAVLGASAILWGSIQAIRAPRLKPLVAYSTVAQLGYLFLAFPLAGSGSLAAWKAGAIFAVSHACAKAAFFLAAGNIHLAAGHDRVRDLDGVGARLPRSFLAAGLASVALMGLPPSGTFIAKWMLMQTALETGHGWLAAVMVAGGLLAAVYCFRVLACAFTPASDAPVTPVPRRMDAAALALAVVALVTGLLAGPTVELLGIGAPAGGAP